MLLVIFLMALMLIAVMSAAPSIRTERKREAEEEMIWRGKQYERGVKLYYRKTGKFPTELDDLVKPKMGSLRFMRQAYPDPMNKKDGTWRMIYVGPAGQLIGSLNPSRNLQLPGGPTVGTPVSAMGGGTSAAGALPTAGGSFGSTGTAIGTTGAASGPTMTSSFGSSSFDNNTTSISSGTSSSFGSMFSGNSSTAFSDPDDPENAPPDLNDPKVGGNVDTPPILGGNIIGVGSKINERSVIVYDKAKNYRLFEFIWDPTKDAITIGGSATPIEGAPAGTPVGAPANSNPFGPTSNPGGTMNPGGTQQQPNPQTPPDQAAPPQQ